MVPFAALMIPLFRLIVRFRLLDTHTGLILTSLASVFLIFFFRQSYKSFPKEMIQAARADGAGGFRILWSLAAPTLKAAHAAAALSSLRPSRPNHVWPLVVLQGNAQKSVLLFVSTLASAYFPEYAVVMIAILTSTLPLTVIVFG